jgi:membrane fusion protein, copper/silver efflux system
LRCRWLSASSLHAAAREYFVIARALVESDPEPVQVLPPMIFWPVLGRVDMTLLEDEAHHRWMDLLEGIKQCGRHDCRIQTIWKSSGSILKPLSDNMIEAVEYFGLQIERVYKMHCPMAFDDKGADWLSDRDEILNPYFGDMMLRCGEIKKTYRKGSRVFRTDQEGRKLDYKRTGNKY